MSHSTPEYPATGQPLGGQPVGGEPYPSGASSVSGSAASGGATGGASGVPGGGPGHVRDPSDVSVGQLMGDISRDISTLMRQEVELAKAEVKTEATKAGKAAGMLGGSGVAGYLAVLFLSIAAWAALSNVMDSGLAALIVALVWGAIAAVLFVVGRKKMAEVNPKPEQTVETVQEAPAALKGQAHQTGTVGTNR